MPESFAIMTFNIHHGEGLDGKVNLYRIAEFLKKQHADVIALQEVDRYRLRSGYVDQALELAQLLGMHVCFSASLSYSVGQYGNAILSRYPIVNSARTLLPGDKERRSVLTATLHVGSEDIHIADTHLGLSTEDRTVQMKQISEILAPIQGPLIIAGDFNTDKDPSSLSSQLRQISTLPLLHGLTSTFHSGAVIDHICTNLQNPQPAWTIQTAVSDHFPVMARFLVGAAVRV
ncbi:endonuclease/exonuclease/phosphatase family protein [Paenibacillus sp. GCM10027628]|uniref:endonuclease/exonuclease/phosphatase family protein n=1 Tax=Paenibacillus sp. GCM10027628 TaxID=3273413 RepID=UPI00362B4FF0